MKIYTVHLPTITIEADSPQQAFIGAIQSLAQGKHPVSVSDATRLDFAKKTKPGPADPQTWWPVGQGVMGLNMAQIMCPNGHAILLLANVHHIREDGCVSPSVVCGYQGCPFHSFIRLVGWAA